MRASDLLVEALENEGVEFVFGIPGEENLDLLDSLSRSSIRLVLTRHEQAAGFMAATYGRLTGKAGVCLATLGPGATNLVTPVAYAQLGAMPMVTITGQKPIRQNGQGRFQLIDTVRMMSPITKSTAQIVGSGAIPSMVRDAFRLAQEERPGATHLELPEDVAQEDSAARPIPAYHARRPSPEGEAIAQVIEMLRGARHPLMVIGAAANRKRTSKVLNAFVDHHAIPFVTTQMGKGVIDETHPLYIGTAAMSDNDFPHRAIDQADLILNVGHDVVEKPPFVMDAAGRTVVHINFQPAQIDPVYFPQASVIGDIADSIWRIDQGLTPQPQWDFDMMLKAGGARRDHVEIHGNDMRFPLLPQKVVTDVRRVMPDDGIVALDNGIYKLCFARDYPARHPNTLLLDNALASMGAGLPSAMAARLVYPQRKVMAVCGDGGFMMNSQELETAVRLGMDQVVLILNDGAYGMIKWKQQHEGLRDFGLDFGNPCFVTYARSYGAHGHRVERTEELESLMRDCLDAGGVHLIDVPVDYSLNVRLLHEDIPRLSAAP